MEIKKRMQMMALTPQGGTMPRSPERWEIICSWKSKPTMRSLYVRLILKYLERGPRHYDEIHWFVDQKRREHSAFKKRYWETENKRLKTRLAVDLRELRGLQALLADWDNTPEEEKEYWGSHTTRVYTKEMFKDKIRARRESVIEGVKSLRWAVQQLEKEPEDMWTPWEYLGTLEPGLSQLVARMDAAGMIKRIKRGVYSL